MLPPRSSRVWHLLPPLFTFLLLLGCGATSSTASSPASQTSAAFNASAPAAPPVAPSAQLVTNPLSGDTQPVHDPSIMRQGATYYLFTTDVLGLPPGHSLPIRCSTDKVEWKACGSVFAQIPSWLQAKVPGIVGLWAPDISYFGGLYHLYYAGSTLKSQQSVIGLATNRTLDPHDPAYGWADQAAITTLQPTTTRKLSGAPTAPGVHLSTRPACP